MFLILNMYDKNKIVFISEAVHEQRILVSYNQVKEVIDQRDNKDI